MEYTMQGIKIETTEEENIKIVYTKQDYSTAWKELQFEVYKSMYLRTLL